MHRREFLAASLAPALQTSGKDGGNRPNILIIMSDQHSPHVMGCRGDSVVRTPNLDALAGRGVLFESACCQSPICIPSRMSRLTGAQPSENGVWTNADTLPSSAPTFAHALTAAGYDTALIGNMHFFGADQWHGFGKRLVGSLNPMYPHVPHSLPPQLLAGAAGSTRAAIQVAGPGRTSYQSYDADVTKATVEFLKGKAGQTTGQPWCAVAACVLPHCPYICRKEDWDYYLNRVTIPQTPPHYFERLHPAVKIWRKARGVEDLTVEEIRRARAGYYGLVTQFDRQVGEMLGALKQSGLDSNTVVIYTTDHGEMAGDLGMWWKYSFYEGSVGVPLIVSWPAKFQQGVRSRQVVSHIDIASTLTDLAGAAAVPNTSGHSLRPLLEGRPDGGKNEAFSEFAAASGIPSMRMIRSSNWKLVHYEGYRPQLFDLAADPR
ncbi:MAG: sulfatase-like hydrolase/transferase, partial [Bryobacteraceae bacterium]